MCVESKNNEVPQSNTKDLKCNLPLCIRVVASVYVATHVRIYSCTSLVSRPFVLLLTDWGQDCIYVQGIYIITDNACTYVQS